MWPGTALMLSVKQVCNLLIRGDVLKCGLHVLQYHLECIALEQAPTKWICEACEASGPVQAKCLQK